MADIFGAIGAASNRVLGTLGRGIDVVGQAAGNKAPELKWFGDEGLSGALEYQGSKALDTTQRVEERVSQGKPIAGQDTEVARNAGLNFTYDTNLGIQGNKPAYNNQEASSGATKIATGGKITMGEAAALGLDQGQLWNIISFTSPFVLFVGVLFGVLKFRRLKKSNQLLVFYLGFSLTFDLLSRYFGYIAQSKYNLFLMMKK